MRFGNADPLQRLWREALASPLHGPGCSCSGGGVMLHAGMLEEDLLDFLAARHVGNPGLLQLLDARRDRRQGDFATWLSQGLLAVPAGDRAAVEDQVTGVLRSVVSQSRRCD